VEVEVALIRDWRKLPVVEQADEAVAVQDWQADLAPVLATWVIRSKKERQRELSPFLFFAIYSPNG
jgi:hypothetical protein